MAHEWVLDVLADLQTFADANALPALAAHLDEACLIAAEELVSQEDERTPQKPYAEAIAAGTHPAGVGCRDAA